MKIIVTIVALLVGSYFLLNWAGENPRDANKITKQVDKTASDIVDKGERAVEELSR
jgi:hypothetical protein